MELFPSIISRAKTLQVITSGVNRTANGSLQLVRVYIHLFMHSSSKMGGLDGLGRM